MRQLPEFPDQYARAKKARVMVAGKVSLTGFCKCAVALVVKSLGNPEESRRNFSGRFAPCGIVCGAFGSENQP